MKDEQAATATTADGVTLGGVYLVPALKRRGCVVMLHGIGDTHFGIEGLARTFQSDSFAVLLPDSRGHGWSGGDLVTYGLKEAGDVHAWVNWLEAHDCGAQIYGLGESLVWRGVAAIANNSVLANRAGRVPWITAVVVWPAVYASLGYAFVPTA